ncbi:hypothetical protein F2Q68_00021543 [Brassica cretica]|uniref:Uncharacterized protein n=2 Tax=Brassica cretica TaxID=69181 RepID=A0A8S9FZZ1_BRACR|nr:hypothetical protein F2Q68_00021543 [Brassica cretica]KAF3562918.1 hypothetical protein DY000_02016822 [Brassica cretica]
MCSVVTVTISPVVVAAGTVRIKSHRRDSDMVKEACKLQWWFLQYGKTALRVIAGLVLWFLISFIMAPKS